MRQCETEHWQREPQHWRRGECANAPHGVWGGARTHADLPTSLLRACPEGTATRCATSPNWIGADCRTGAGDLGDADHCRLWEIDENLTRAELSATQEAEHLAERKQLWARMRGAESGASCATLPATGRGNTQFAADTASSTGRSKATINRAVARAEAVCDDARALLVGTRLDTGAYLDRLMKVEPAHQVERVQRDLAAINDENLTRAELTATQEAEHLAERKRLWARMRAAETGGASCASSLADGRAAGPQHAMKFAADTASSTGRSKATINRAVARAEHVTDHARALLVGTRHPIHMAYLEPAS